METFEFSVIIAMLILFTLISKRIQITAFTAPMIFVGCGALLGSTFLGVIKYDFSVDAIHSLAEMTLVLVLFVDAAKIHFGTYRADRGLPRRLLWIGLPLTILAGYGVAVLLFGQQLAMWEAALVAVILAPTDAALGQAVVSNERVPLRIRQALNVESGLNDGICVPVLKTFGLAAAVAAGEASGGAGFWTVFARALGYGGLIGFGVGFVVTVMMRRAHARGWVAESYAKISLLATPLLMFALAEAIGGSGFIAAFVGGMTVGNTKGHLDDHMLSLAEESGEFLGYLTWIIFGAAIVGPALVTATVPAILYAVLSLTVVRMVPVAIAMIRSGEKPDTVAFLGWFGPRGLASVVFVIIAVHGAGIEHGDTIFLVAAWTILLSVILHGASANAGASWYANRQAGSDGAAGA